ncbi:MAG: hypothetical protein A2934_03175 [Candidatus Sungbacteria bacterium RIFCSPLOWO2_01_FULL_47_10]|uniref:Uncharacterized protein n=1 Tax=Candidatus Sungbacteria bacterium RIFCSPLOWO2_01_FULL_47_10 TaxID=1802276 RepID=A0A1G2L6G8_9BACT|nr:MAG: hypothetical protein A2934_03175 [Candidatus Sungbacteria bacterium RIFCSPLOWO2_01_FULL_47_10]
MIKSLINKHAIASDKKTPVWCFLMLAWREELRKVDWAEEYKYPTVTLAQMNQLLAECREDQPAVAL